MPLKYSDVLHKQPISPQFVNRFEIEIELEKQLQDYINKNSNLIKELKLIENNKIILHEQTSITIPDITVETLEVPNVSYNLKQQQAITFGEEVTITLVERNDFRWRIFFETWLKQLYDYINIAGTIPQGYKQKTLTITLKQKILPLKSNTSIENAQDITIQVYTFYRPYPTSFQGREMNYSSTELVTSDVTFRYDYYTEKFFGKLDLLTLKK